MAKDKNLELERKAKYKIAMASRKAKRLQKNKDNKLCKEVGAKYFERSNFPTLAYSMTKEEALDASQKLLLLIPKSETLFKDFKIFFAPDATYRDLEEAIKYYSDRLLESEGYNCL